RHTIPINQVKSLFATGHVSVTSGVLSFFSKIGIPIHFFGHYGNFLGSYQPRKKLVSGHTVLMQARAVLDSDTRQEIASKFVKSCLYNMQHVLISYPRNIPRVSDKVELLKEITDSVDPSEPIPVLMSKEGRAWAVYYSAFDLIIRDHDMGPRIRRPPNNPINALISLGNSILYGIVLTQIYHTQLDPSISFLHEPLERRYSLALDIAEVFKPTLVDTLIFKLLNKDMLQESHFDERINYCMLTEEGRRIFLTNFDERLRETRRHARLKRNVSNEYMIRLDCYKLMKRVVENKGFQPYLESKGS
ncbi:MAG: type I-B CRISPR-associated endonuclease Cas1b, partial [Candidatus Thorarchaeota archaeon]|nr:type I-B CRISPR-associated endonuclease Cas1b [Candidatus Thorarchaeota archaeon]